MKESLKFIWNNHRVKLLNYIKTKVSDEYAAEDILQEVFIKTYKNIEQLDNPHSLKPWLYRITNNTIIDFYRKSNPLIFLDEISYQLVIEEDSVNINQEVATCLKLFLYKLPDKYREPLELFEFYGMKHKEIAKKLNLSLSGSKTRILRAKERLKELLIECCQFETDSYGNIIDYKQKKNNNINA